MTALFERVKSVYNAKATLSLTEEQQTLLDKKYKGFSRNGANLNAAQKEILARDRQRAKPTPTHLWRKYFSRNQPLRTSNYGSAADLEGLPEGAMEAAKQMADEKDTRKDGYSPSIIPSYVPFMTYAKNRGLRKQLALSLWSKRIPK